jgi:hypothetical protein
MADFASYLTITILLSFALFNIFIVPIRYGCCQSTIADIVHQCALKRKLSAAVQELKNSLDAKTAFMAMQGVHVKEAKLYLVISSIEKSKVVSLDENEGLPLELLPDGSHGPFEYQLKVHVDVDIDPLIGTKAKGIPGLNGPVALTIDQLSHWENVGRDLATNQYYLRE